MTITETQKTAQLAADAAVSAAEAKQYMLEAEQGYQDTSAAAQQAQDAAGSALLSKQSAATSEENSLQYATEAGVARDEAVASASTAAEFGDNKLTFADTTAGLAGTTSGQYFRVPQGVGNVLAFRYYKNNAGVAVEVAEYVGQGSISNNVRQYATLSLAQSDVENGNITSGAKCFVLNSSDSTIADEYLNSAGTLISTGRYIASKKSVDDINTRTEGLKTQSDSVYPVEIIDATGKSPWFIDDNGATNTPGGTITTFVNASDVNSDRVSSSQITPTNIISNSNGDSFPAAFIDQAGHVLWAWNKTTGRPICLGEPLSNHRGPLNGDVFAIGDSITAYGVAWSGANATGTSYAPCLNDQSWQEWASLFTNGQIRLSGVSATGGYTVTQVKNTHLPVAIAANSTFCIVMCGRNDIVQGINIDTVTIPAFKSIFLQLRQAGIMPVVCTMSAQGNSGSTTQRTAEHQLNSWLRAYAKAKSLPFVDLHRYTVDPLTGDWISGYNQDVSHPNGTGAKAMGQAVVDGLKEWVIPYFPARADEQLASGLSQNLITNALFLNNTGTNPSDWTITTAGTATISTDPAVKGNVWNITNQEAYLTVSATAGQRMLFGFFVKTGSQFDCYVLSGTSSSTTNLAGIRNWKTSITDFSYFCYEFVVPSGVTQLTVKTKAAASSCSIAQIALIKLTEI